MNLFASLLSLVALLLHMSTSVTYAATARRNPIPDRDIVFPSLVEKGLGDPCQVQYPGDRYPKAGFCTRVGECGTFPLRVFYQPNFNVYRELCYFEVHDPVVCCLGAREFDPTVVQRTELTRDWPYEFDSINNV